MRAGAAPERIQITAQQLPENLEALSKKGVRFTACSLHQLRAYGACRPNTEVAARINPGLGSGHSNRTNTGGPSSSFGIWHAHLDEALAIAKEYDLRITGMHTHIGSGSDPEMWVKCADMALDVAARLPEVTRLSLGGGFKVARMASETAADLHAIGARVQTAFEAFAERHGRKLHLEIEPGTFLVANCGSLVSTVMDVMDTGSEGYDFLKVDTGMTDILRPSLYGAQHPLVVVPAQAEARQSTAYLVAGHCCESGDILTPQPGDSEGVMARELTTAHIGDALVVEAVGAYCCSMTTKNYNSFPESAEVLRTAPGVFKLIRKRQDLEQILQNEIPL